MDARSSSENVAVFRSDTDGLTYIVDDAAAGTAVPVRLEHADRCATLEEMQEGEEHVILPVSSHAMQLWKEAVVSPLACRSWGVERAPDIHKLAEVRAVQMTSWIHSLRSVPRPLDATQPRAVLWPDLSETAKR